MRIWPASGYPAPLTGSGQPPVSRILAVCSTFPLRCTIHIIWILLYYYSLKNQDLAPIPPDNSQTRHLSLLPFSYAAGFRGQLSTILSAIWQFFSFRHAHVQQKAVLSRLAQPLGSTASDTIFSFGSFFSKFFLFPTGFSPSAAPYTTAYIRWPSVPN